jgi:hypothetical protein
MRKFFTLLVLFLIAQQYVTAQTVVTSRTINFKELAAYEAAHPELFRDCKTCKEEREADEGWEEKANPNMPFPPGAIIKRQAVDNTSNSPILMAPSRNPVQNFLGHVDANTTIPPDTHGAVGLNHVITATNNFIKIHNKVGGAQVSQVSISTFTGVSSTCDPYMTFDPSAQRWIFSAIHCGAIDPNPIILMVSNTADPTGTWRVITWTTVGAGFLDHPYLGFDATKIVVSGRRFNSAGTAFFGSSLYLIDKAAMYAGTPITFGTNAQRIDATDGVDAPLPVTVYDPPFSNVGNPSPGTFYVLQSFNNTSIRLTTVTGNIPSAVWNTGTGVFPTGGTAWNSNGLPNSVQQTVETRLLAANDDRISCGVMMNGKIWAAHHIAFPTSGQPTNIEVQWWQLDGAPGATFGNVLQRGRVASAAGEYKWFPSIAVNKNEDVLIGYSMSSTTTRVSAAYSTRQASTPANTTDDPFIYKAGLDRYWKDFSSGRARWGDYSHSSLDPVDNSLWTIQEYAETGAGPIPPDGNSRWSTWWAQVPASAAGPTVTINQAVGQADPTGTSPINFTVVFSSAVTGFATGDVTLSGTAGATTGTVTGSGTTYNVAVSGMTGSGTVIASIAADVAVDGSSNGNQASTSTDNTVTFNLPDVIPPTVTINQAAAQTDPTAASPINFTVVFNETVTGFATGDVTLSGTAGATTATVTGSGTTYNVAVSGMTGTGTVIATVPAAVAIDGSGNPNLASTSTDNSVTFNATPPSVTINQAVGQADPTGTSPINFTVVFNEPVTGFVTGDVVLSGTAGATTATVTGSGTTYNVAVSGMTVSGTVIANVPAAVAIDIDGNDNTASTSTDNTVTFNSCVLTCPANITVSNTAGQCGAIVTYPAPVASLGCGTVTATPASGSFFPIGTTTVNVSSTSGATCSFTIRVNDTQPPTITCPANIVVSNTLNQCGAIVNFTPVAADNCPIGTTTPRNLTQSASNTVTPGGSVFCGQTGFHRDNSYWRAYDLAPLSLAGPLTINSVTFGIETANAAGVGTTQPVTVRLHTSAGAFPGGVRTQVGTQTYNIADQTNSLFTATLATPVTVPANAILVLEIFTPDGLAAGHTFLLGTNSGAETAPSYISSVACSLPTPATTASVGFPNARWILNAAGTVPVPGSGTVSVPASGSFFPVGTTTVTSTATDGAGNTASCTFTVRVNDTQAPTINCPANITVTTAAGSCVAPVTYAVTAADNCPGVTTALTAGLASGSDFPIGVNTVTYRATDAAGNTTTCSFTVTVIDGQLPVISAQPVNRTVCTGSNAIFSVTSSNAVSYQWQQFISGVWTNIAGATGSALTLNNVNLGMNDNSYRVNVIGLCTSVTSGFATLFVNPLPTISLTTTNSPVLLPTENTSISAIVSPTGGSFAWFKNGAPLVPAVTIGTLSNLTVENVGTYRAVYTDANGCVNTSGDVIVSAEPSDRLYVAPNPNFGQFWVRYYNQLNEQLTLSVFNSNGKRVYQKAVATTLAYTRIDVDLNINAPGVYLVELHNSAGKLLGSKKIIVSHR